MASDHVHDLPLMANSKAFHLYHSVMQLICHMDQHIFSGCIYLFLNPARTSSHNRQVFSIREYQQQMADMCQTGATATGADVPAQVEVSTTKAIGRLDVMHDTDCEITHGSDVHASEVMHDSEIMHERGHVQQCDHTFQ
jgi:hypothetical protein